MNRTARLVAAPITAAALIAGGLALAGPAAAGSADHRRDRTTCTAEQLVPARTPDVKAQVAALDKVAYLVGKWKGSGWMDSEQGRVWYEQNETIQRKLSGQLILVEGLGTTTDKSKTPVFRAFATLRYDTAKKQYLWTAQSEADPITVPFEVTPTGWAWEIPVGGPVKVRYETTHSHNNTKWHETGRITQDGKNWTTFQEMTLWKQC